MSNETNYFNLHVTGLGYLNNVREVQTRNGSMLCCSINALTGATDNPGYTRFDIMVVGKESSELISALPEGYCRGKEGVAWLSAQQSFCRCFHADKR